MEIKKSSAVGAENNLIVAVVLVLAVLIGGALWLSKKKQAILDSNQKVISAQENKRQGLPISEACEKHYYEGDEQIHVWLGSGNADESQLVIRIDSRDLDKLPENAKIKNSVNLQLKLIDPTKELREKLANSSENNPILISIKGYAEICEDIPQVSLGLATIAFKKG